MLLLVGGALFFALICFAAIGLTEAHFGLKRLNEELAFQAESVPADQNAVTPELAREIRVSAPNVPADSIAA